MKWNSNDLLKSVALFDFNDKKQIWPGRDDTIRDDDFMSGILTVML